MQYYSEVNNRRVVIRMITYASLSKRGGREYNEDRILCKRYKKDYLFAVADGLGGHGNGDVASETALQAVQNWRKQEDILQSVTDCFEEAQRQVRDRKQQDSNLRGMMTTMVLLQIRKKQILWGHIGDSRLYYFQDRELISHTLDHSVPQYLVMTGEITEEEIRHHPDRNRLLRSIGLEWERPLFQLGELIEKGGSQQFLLCSDGFWEYIGESEMEDLLKSSRTPKQWLRRMEQIVLKNGQDFDMDNYSAVAVWSK